MPQPSIYTLTGCHSQLLFEVNQGVELRYWGRKLQHLPEQAGLSWQRPIAWGRLDDDIPLTLTPQLACGVFSSPALEGHRDGQDWAPEFSICDITTTANTLSVISRDERAQLQLLSELYFDESDVLKIRHQLTNLASDSYQLNRLAITLPVPERAQECLSFYGRWLYEFQISRQKLSSGGCQLENRRGRTSHEHYPALIVGSENFNEMSGEVWGFHLAYSGNHRLRVDVKADGRRFVQAETLYFPGEITLEQHQSITTPWLYASYSAQGLNQMSQQFHEFVRQHLLKEQIAKRPRPVHLNTWEGIYFDHRPDYIIKMAQEAAQMGVERFIIDDGWFEGRNDDTAGLGDWFLDKTKYPKGLEPVITAVQSFGMKFGLWFEPEMVNPLSKLYKTHPDWVLGLSNYQAPLGRHQYVLDLQNPDVFDYLLARLDALLMQYDIDYIKWDMNREVVQPAHAGRAAGDGQVQHYYQLIDAISERHPHLEIESCAAGGGRIDYAVLSRVHRFWVSDNNDALERQSIQRGMSYFFPPEVMGCHIGAHDCHSTGRQSDIGFRGITALFGHMGVELDPLQASEEEKAGFAKYISLHKRFRSLLHHGVNWRLMTDDPAQLAYSVVAKDKQQALIVVAQLTHGTYILSGSLRIPGLLADTTYQVELLDKPKDFSQIVNRQPPWTNQPICLTGQWLERVGLAMPLLNPQSALLIRLSAL